MNQELDNKKTSVRKDDTLDDIDTIFYDKFVTLRCSDGKKLVVSKRRLDIFGFYNKIFTDLEEMDCVHTSEEMLILFEYCCDHIRFYDKIPVLSKLMHYYNLDSKDKYDLIGSPGDIALLHPGSEYYFKEVISDMFSHTDRITWLKSTSKCEFSIRMKAILYDIIIEYQRKNLI